MNAAKIIWNINGWTCPDGQQVNGINVPGINGNYTYGLEEFNFCEELLNNQLAYVDCYRRIGVEYNEPVDLALFSRCPDTGQIFHIGNLFNVIQITDQDRINIFETFNNNDYLEQFVIPAFNVLEEVIQPEIANGVNVYIGNNYGLNIDNIPFVQAPAPHGFFVNIKYGRLIIFETPVNLSIMFPEINIKWRKLSVRYIVENLKNEQIIEYFQNSFNL